MTDKLEDIEASIDLSAPIGRVWHALTTPEQVEIWLGCLQFKPEIGHVFYMQPDQTKRESDDITGATHCEILEITPKKRLAFSWFLPGTPKTTVAIDVEELSASQTRVTLSHNGWDQFEPEAIRVIWEQLKGGWIGHVLPQLKSFIETEKDTEHS